MTVSAQPAHDASVELADGRRLAYAEWGPTGGRPILALYGTPGSRLFCPDIEATDAAGVRLIAIDRPGYGRSDPRPGLTVPDVCQDLAELHTILHLPPCPVFGWSGGGPYALGLAVGHPAIATAVGVAASWGPLRRVPDAWGVLPAERRALLDLAARDPNAARPAVELVTQWYAEDPDRIVDGLTDAANPDHRLHRDPTIGDAMRTWFREGARQGTAGFVDDWIATYARDWDFDLAGIARPTTIWWGDGDAITSRSHAEYLAGAVPGAALVVFPGDGHLAPILHWPEILATLQRETDESAA